MERHRFDPLSAVSGLLFVGIGLAFMSNEVDVLDVDIRVAVALVFLFVGLLIAGFIFRAPARGADALSPDSEPDENQPTQRLPLS